MNSDNQQCIRIEIKPISSEQLIQLQKELEKEPVIQEQILKHFNIKSLGEVPSSLFYATLKRIKEIKEYRINPHYPSEKPTLQETIEYFHIWEKLNK
jgi:hypothetical protein